MRVVAFIVVPKNTGLRKYREKALSLLDRADRENFVEARGEDVPFWVEKLKEKGKVAIGLTGEDLYREYCLEEREVRLKVLKRIAWDDPRAVYGKPALCLMGPKGKGLDTLPDRLTVGIPEKYKRIAKKYLNYLETRGYTFEKLYISGSIETSCSQGITDLVIDIVYSGGTMEENGLKIYDKIMESDFLIIGGKSD